MLQQLQKTTETQDKISAVREELVELERSAGGGRYSHSAETQE